MSTTTECLKEIIKDDSGDSNMLDYLNEFVESPSSSVNYAVESRGKNVFDRILLDVKFGSIDETNEDELDEIILFFKSKGVIKAKKHRKISSSDYADSPDFLRLLKSINPNRSRSRSKSRSRSPGASASERRTRSKKKI